MRRKRFLPLLSRLLWTGLVPALLAACAAPPSVPLKGGAAAAIRKGIEAGTGVMDHSRFDRVLRQHAWAMGSRFDYAGLRKDPEDLDLYLREVGKADLARLSRDELMALLANAYNAYVLQSILETFTPRQPDGVDSIRDIPHVFDRPTHLVGGFKLSLNNIEHNLLRPLFKDPRVHFVVSCASVSCPPLLQEALTGAKLEAQLEYAAHRTLSSPEYVRVDDGALHVTKLLDWYGSDFVDPSFHGSEKTLSLYIRKYASEDVARWLDSAGRNPPITFMEYDWSLNRERGIRFQDLP
jgi:Protein of unknown function, DUF547